MIKTSKPFLGEDFLLQTDAAVALYHQYAAPQPIIDYHNHLSPRDIALNRQFNNLTEAWLEGDHYKWRAMRTLGIPEQYCTGAAGPREKFMKWAETVPHTLRNPLFHWTHLELKNYFGIDRLLNPASAAFVFEECNARLQSSDYAVQPLLAKMNVKVVCTTDDPCDSLEYHRKLKNAAFTLLPTFRPDPIYNFSSAKSWNGYIDRLADAAGQSISSLTDLVDALQKRVDYFASLGCRASDHGLEFLPYAPAGDAVAAALFNQLRNRQPLLPEQQLQLRTWLLLRLAEMYHTKGWAQQFHLGALRNNNSRSIDTLGADTGFDSIGDFPQAATLARFFDDLNGREKLAKTIIYNLNPADNEVFASMIGNFNDGSHPGKIQYGAAWWFLDQKDGMEKQLNALSNLGLLSQFIGMVTDSRSFLSFPRHEYFRRTLCNLLGSEMERGELPDDLELIGRLVGNICYHNVQKYFDLG
jgi:glucuronate isomerase